MSDDDRFDGDIPDDPYEDAYYLQDQLSAFGLPDDYDFTRLDQDDIHTAMDIMDNIFDAGFFPQEGTIDRLSDLLGVEYDLLYDYFEGQEVDWESYSET